MNCLVTGGAGFIGHHIVNKLVELKHRVVVIDDESASATGSFHWNEKCDNYKYNICDFNKIEPLFSNINYVFHLAAESRIQVAIHDPSRAVNVNCLGTVNVMQCSRKHNVDKVIYSSTSSYYGLKNGVPNVETMDRDCLNPYSVTKVAGEDIIKMYTNLFNIKSVIFRYFNVYGENQPTKGQYAPVIGLFQKMKKQGKKMTVVGDGLARRDYTHVSDVVNANILAAQNDNVGNAEIINIGTGVNYSVLDLVKLLGGPYVHIPPREGEAKETLADISNAKKYLDWNPKVNLEEWIKKNKLL